MSIDPESAGLKRKMDAGATASDTQTVDATATASTSASAASVASSEKGTPLRGRGGKRGRGGGGRGSYTRNDGAGAGDSDDSSMALAVPPASSSAPSGPLTPIQQQFSLFAAFLDQRNDRREAVYVASRELTRSSKKLISQLQRFTHLSPDERDKQLASARSQQLAELHRMLAATVSDLSADESHRLAGAYSPGFQEFIESASFLHFLEHGTLITHGEIERDIAATLDGRHVAIPISDYIVGVMDLGGELMRYATNSVTTGERATVLAICSFLRDVYAKLQALSATVPLFAGPYREMNKKMEVWMQSLQKIEALAYKLHIRGAEIRDPHMLALALAHDRSSGGGGGGFDDRDAGGAGGGDDFHE